MPTVALAERSARTVGRRERLAFRWPVARAFGLGGALTLAGTGFIDPPLALLLFWGWFVPALPLVFLVAPGLWRNVCPMATLTVSPGTRRRPRRRRLSPAVQQAAPWISIGLFLLIIPLRLIILDRSGPALGVFLLLMLALAYTGGLVVPGKSGWCSQFCPMLQIERFYGQSPLRVVRDTHCRPCVGCTKRCYDLLPTTAQLADLQSDNRGIARSRLFCAAIMPWLCLAFFTQSDLVRATPLGALAVYERLFLFGVIGLCIFWLLRRCTSFTANHLALGHVVAACNLYYAFVLPGWLHDIGMASLPARVAAQAAVGALTVLWLRRAAPTEGTMYLRRRLQGISSVLAGRKTGRAGTPADTARA